MFRSLRQSKAPPDARTRRSFARRMGRSGIVKTTLRIAISMDQPERMSVREHDEDKDLDRALARQAGTFAAALLLIMVVLLYVLR